MGSDVRTISGVIQLPADASAGEWAEPLVELRDVSLLDAPSRVVVSLRLPRSQLGPGAALPFALTAPSVPAGVSLNLRAELRLVPNPDLDRLVAPGQVRYLTTVACAVPGSGQVVNLVVPVSRVSG